MTGDRHFVTQRKVVDLVLKPETYKDHDGQPAKCRAIDTRNDRRRQY